VCRSVEGYVPRICRHFARAAVARSQPRGDDSWRAPGLPRQSRATGVRGEHYKPKHRDHLVRRFALLRSRRCARRRARSSLATRASQRQVPETITTSRAQRGGVSGDSRTGSRNDVLAAVGVLDPVSDASSRGRSSHESGVLADRAHLGSFTRFDVRCQPAQREHQWIPTGSRVRLPAVRLRMARKARPARLRVW